MRSRVARSSFTLMVPMELMIPAAGVKERPVPPSVQVSPELLTKDLRMCVFRQALILKLFNLLMALIFGAALMHNGLLAV